MSLAIILTVLAGWLCNLMVLSWVWKALHPEKMQSPLCAAVFVLVPWAYALMYALLVLFPEAILKLLDMGES